MNVNFTTPAHKPGPRMASLDMHFYRIPCFPPISSSILIAEHGSRAIGGLVGITRWLPSRL
ncbi:MAG TPA: hypothetical protein VKA08_01365 [Balneolales bacterium]|nr:hypothetical protein [Balneolales bacterium]